MQAENGKLKYRVRARERSVKQIRGISLRYRAVCTPHKQNFYSDMLSRFQLSAFILQLFSDIPPALLYPELSNCGLGESDRAGSIGGTGAYVGPFYLAVGIDNISDRRRNGAGPVALVFGANGANQLDLGIGEKTNG